MKYLSEEDEQHVAEEMQGPSESEPPVRSSDLLCVTVADGKYTVKQDATGRLTALRYGEPWRDCCGDGLIYMLAAEVETLREQLARVTHNVRTKLRHE